MDQRLVNIKEDLDRQELQAKVAAVNEVWGDNDEALGLLCDAIDEIEKQAEAGAFGEGGLTDSQILTLGVQYAESALEEIAKEAAETTEVETEEVETEVEAEATEEVDAELQEKIAAAYEQGFELGYPVGDFGVTSEDIEKIANAPEEEVEQFAQFLGRLSVVEDDEEVN